MYFSLILVWLGAGAEDSQLLREILIHLFFNRAIIAINAEMLVCILDYEPTEGGWKMMK